MWHIQVSAALLLLLLGITYISEHHFHALWLLLLLLFCRVLILNVQFSDILTRGGFPILII